MNKIMVINKLNLVVTIGKSNLCLSPSVAKYLLGKQQSSCSLSLSYISGKRLSRGPPRPLVNYRSCWAHRWPLALHRFSVLCTFLVTSRKQTDGGKQHVGFFWEFSGGLDKELLGLGLRKS